MPIDNNSFTAHTFNMKNTRRRYDGYFDDNSLQAGLVICAMAVIIAGVILLLTQTSITITPRNNREFPPLEINFDKYLETAEQEGADAARALYRSDVVRNAERTTRRLQLEWERSFAGKMERALDILSGKEERSALEYEKWKALMNRYISEELLLDAPPPTRSQDGVAPLPNKSP